MTIFDKTAVEAAARALGTTDFEAGFEDGDDESRNFWRAKTALSAAESSMRERELVRDGNAYQTESTSKGWYAYDAKDLHENEFPVTTIRKETP